MEVVLKELQVQDLVSQYEDNDEDGVRGYFGKLDIRPPYQRNFVYKKEQRNAVIETILKGFPLNVMYWADRGDGTYEIIDGQQRTISIAQYVEGDFSVDGLYFDNQPKDIQGNLLEYDLTVYVCSGTDSEKLEWFRTINIAGEELTNQELRNAVYAGSWVSDAKRYFSKTGCPAYQIGQDYLKGSPIRQKFLETAIKWISNGNIEDYMGMHQSVENAEELWGYYRSVIDWVEKTFTEKRSIMKGVAWGDLYNHYKDETLDPDEIESEIARLIMDDDVTRQPGIYSYILDRDEKHLNIRTFSKNIKQRVYEKQNGKCAMCNEKFDMKKMEADHITPWVEGGKTEESNCQMLCKKDNLMKGSK
ncbi:MAG: DUF262 domain-containing protein [Gammaproteobacteria bacterium]|nr:DUF262 domain-containing protein [Gammaproteobacteria bacterium]